MRRRQVYLAFVLLLLTVMGIQRIDALFSVRAERGPIQGASPKAWTPLIVEDVNRSGIRMTVDGREWKAEREPIIMTDRKCLMIPVSMVTRVFSCAENFYDKTMLVLERGSARLELRLGEAGMTVNGAFLELKEPLTERDGSLYLPLEAIEKGLNYDVKWSIEERALYLSSKDAEAGILPQAYDYRKAGRTGSVKNQGTLGTCWSFASLQALETSLMPEEPYIFSVDHMTLNNGFNLTQDDGGEYTMSMAYLLAWQGPVPEEEDPYGDGYSPPGLTPVKHVQEIQILPGKDYEKIKRAVYLYGGVQSSLYTSLKNYRSRSVFYNRSASAYCYIGTEKPNHDVVIVGWDDNYPKENFNMELEGDGAFICMNSWGEEFGDNGYFYVSYYDTNIGIHNILYTDIQSTDNYDHIYQSDLCGWIGQLGYGEESAYFANVYQAGVQEDLTAAGFYATGPNTRYEVFVKTGLEKDRDFSGMVSVAEGGFDNAGYYTVPFTQPVKLKDGEEFAVIVRITTPGSVHPIAIEYDDGEGKADVVLEDGEGYISLHGNKWEHVETEQKCNICLKVYTRDRG